MITMEEYKGIRNAIDDTDNDDTPYAAVVDNDLHVYGDPNKTKTKNRSYVMQFGFPNTPEWRKAVGEDKIINETENYILVEERFENVFITPRMQSAVVSSFVEFLTFFNKVNADGDVEDFGVDEVRAILRELSDDLENSIYRAVGKVLGVDERWIDYMLISNVINTCIKLIQDFPEIINEADLFFG